MLVMIIIGLVKIVIFIGLIKPGSTNVTNKDANGNTIKNPLDCELEI